jgi:hypothetical protein
VWAGGEYGLVAERMAPIHDQLVERLEPRTGERWLDVGTGTGAIAIRRAGTRRRERAADRVCRPGGRLGLTAWRASAELRALYESAGIGPEEPDPTRWSDETHVRRLLGDAFELEPDVWRIDFEAPEQMWEWWSAAVPRFAAMLRNLPPERHAAVRDEMRAVAERGRTDEGIEFTRDYVLVLGRRR